MNIKLPEFLAQAKQKEFWADKRVICFTAPKYPLFFFQTLFSFLREHEIISLTNLPTQSKKQLWETLDQSFLGQTSFYWLGNSVDEKLAKILALYRGPHSIALFLPSEHRTRMPVMIDLKNDLTSSDVSKLFNFFGVAITGAKRAALEEIISSSGTVSLDTACMLMHYLSVTNIKFIEDLKKNLATLIAPELSLISLASAFFKKQERTFFSLWSERYIDYPVPFWTTYWSEQLWRAYHVVSFLKENNFPAARRFSFRLPSSFLRYDWRQCSRKQLLGAYKMVYNIDFAFKTGAIQDPVFHSFDLLYSTYFLNKFS